MCFTRPRPGGGLALSQSSSSAVVPVASWADQERRGFCRVGGQADFGAKLEGETSFKETMAFIDGNFEYQRKPFVNGGAESAGGTNEVSPRHRNPLIASSTRLMMGVAGWRARGRGRARSCLWVSCSG
jgi:hypothetical protein